MLLADTLTTEWQQLLGGGGVATAFLVLLRYLLMWHRESLQEMAATQATALSSLSEETKKGFDEMSRHQEKRDSAMQKLFDKHIDATIEVTKATSQFSNGLANITNAVASLETRVESLTKDKDRRDVQRV